MNAIDPTMLKTIARNYTLNYDHKKGHVTKIFAFRKGLNSTIRTPFVSTIEPSSYVCTYICTLSFCASSRLRQLAQSSTSYIPPTTASSQHRFDNIDWFIGSLHAPDIHVPRACSPSLVYRHDGQRVHTMWLSRSLGSTLALPFAKTSYCRENKRQYIGGNAQDNGNPEIYCWSTSDS
jgi:hypothetical protein